MFSLSKLFQTGSGKTKQPVPIDSPYRVILTLCETWVLQLTRIVPGSRGQYAGTERVYPIAQATIGNKKSDDGAEAVMRSE